MINNIDFRDNLEKQKSEQIGGLQDIIEKVGIYENVNPEENPPTVKMLSVVAKMCGIPVDDIVNSPVPKFMKEVKKRAEEKLKRVEGLEGLE